MSERKGILTPNQEKGVDKLIKLDGIAEILDGPAIKVADNKVIEKLKKKIPAKYLDDVYGMVDELLMALGVNP